MNYSNARSFACSSYRLFGLLLIALFPAVGFIFDHVSSGLWYLIMLLGLISLGLGRCQWLEVLREPAVRWGVGALGLYLIVMLANVALIDHSEFAMSRMERQLLLLGMPLCLVWLAVLRPSVASLLRSFAVGGIIFGVYSLWYRVAGPGGRIDGVTHAIHLGNAALILAILSPLPLVYEKQRSVWLWLLCLAGVILGGLTSLWSYSRGGWIAIPPLALIVILIGGLRFGRPVRTLLAGSVGLVLAIALLAQTETVERRWEQTVQQFQKFGDGEQYNSIGIRLVMWESTLGIIKEAPLFGQGFSAHGDALEAGVEEGRYPKAMLSFKSEPHNQYLFETTAKGLIGLASFLLLTVFPIAMLIKPAIHGNRQALAVALAGILSLTFYLIYGLTITVLNQRRVIHMFGFLYAVILYLSWSEVLRVMRFKNNNTSSIARCDMREKAEYAMSQE